MKFQFAAILLASCLTAINASAASNSRKPASSNTCGHVISYQVNDDGSVNVMLRNETSDFGGGFASNSVESKIIPIITASLQNPQLLVCASYKDQNNTGIASMWIVVKSK